MTRACKTCCFGKSRGFDDVECRKRAPTSETVPHHQDLRRHLPVFPIMRGDDWCAEYGQDYEKHLEFHPELRAKVIAMGGLDA